MKHSRTSPHGFTLIELLVVIAIIAILAAILFPVFAQARDKARQSACLSNMKQIGLGLMQYVQDYDETYPGDLMAVPAINGGTDNRMPYDSQFAPYVKNDQIYTCPSDHQERVPVTNGGLSCWDGTCKTKGIPRSYSYLAHITTDHTGVGCTGTAGNDTTNTGMSTYANNGLGNATSTGRQLAQIDQPSDTLAFVENWPAYTGGPATNSAYVGSSSGAAFANCDIWKLAGRTPGATTGTMALSTPCSGSAGQKPTDGHQGGANYLKADGSAKWYLWSQVRANDFAVFKLKKCTSVTFTP